MHAGRDLKLAGCWLALSETRVSVTQIRRHFLKMNRFGVVPERKRARSARVQDAAAAAACRPAAKRRQAGSGGGAYPRRGLGSAAEAQIWLLSRWWAAVLSRHRQGRREGGGGVSRASRAGAGMQLAVWMRCRCRVGVRGDVGNSTWHRGGSGRCARPGFLSARYSFSLSLPWTAGGPSAEALPRLWQEGCTSRDGVQRAAGRQAGGGRRRVHEAVCRAHLCRHASGLSRGRARLDSTPGGVGEWGR